MQILDHRQPDVVPTAAGEAVDAVAVADPFQRLDQQADRVALQVDDPPTCPGRRGSGGSRSAVDELRSSANATATSHGAAPSDKVARSLGGLDAGAQVDHGVDAGVQVEVVARTGIRPRIPPGRPHPLELPTSSGSRWP